MRSSGNYYRFKSKSWISQNTNKVIIIIFIITLYQIYAGYLGTYTLKTCFRLYIIATILYYATCNVIPFIVSSIIVIPGGKRPLERPRRRWVDNIRMHLQEVGCGYVDWIRLAQDRDRWQTLVSAVMNLRVP